MEKNIKKAVKTLAKFTPEELKEVLEFLSEEDDEDTKEKIIKEEVIKEEPKPEVKEEPKEKVVTLTEKGLEELLAKFASNFVTRDEVKDIKEKVDTDVKKAQPFGVDTKTPPVKTTSTVKTAQDWVNELNQKY